MDELLAKGVYVRVSRKNAACYSEAKELLQECMSVGPVGGLFNLAMVCIRSYGLLAFIGQSDITCR